jgi:uncharacterized heparinase superfamily protein
LNLLEQFLVEHLDLIEFASVTNDLKLETNGHLLAAFLYSLARQRRYLLMVANILGDSSTSWLGATFHS